MKATTIMGLGAIGFALLALLAIVLAGGWMEDDLAGESRADLEANGQGWASVEMDGRDATLTGSAPDAAAAEQAMKTVADVWGVRVVHDETVKP